MLNPFKIDPKFRSYHHRFLAGAIRWLTAPLAAALIASATAAAAEESPAGIETNQAFIEALQRGARLKIESVEDALGFVFSHLPDKVSVYPTENYYYYTFSSGGVVYAGNLRLAAQDRDKGVLHFAAFKQANQSRPAGRMLYKALTIKDGVKVEKLKPLSYRVTYKGKPVVFQLNDVSAVKPPKEIIAAGEKYLGLVVDESGLRFFLFYNEIHKIFAYVLDESGDVLDQFDETKESKRILIGQRTGFAFYNHHYLDRRVLIGVHGGNTVVNNYYDGPADQLPENHIVNDNLRKSIVDSNPSMKGSLDAFGYFKSGEGRYLIGPYIQYESTQELVGYDQCASDPDLATKVYDACFISDLR